jgi:hypothetical protein
MIIQVSQGLMAKDPSHQQEGKKERERERKGKE